MLKQQMGGVFRAVFLMATSCFSSFSFYFLVWHDEMEGCPEGNVEDRMERSGGTLLFILPTLL